MSNVWTGGAILASAIVDSGHVRSPATSASRIMTSTCGVGTARAKPCSKARLDSPAPNHLTRFGGCGRTTTSTI